MVGSESPRLRFTLEQVIENECATYASQLYEWRVVIKGAVVNESPIASGSNGRLGQRMELNPQSKGTDQVDNTAERLPSMHSSHFQIFSSTEKSEH